MSDDKTGPAYWAAYELTTYAGRRVERELVWGVSFNDATHAAMLVDPHGDTTLIRQVRCIDWSGPDSSG